MKCKPYVLATKQGQIPRISAHPPPALHFAFSTTLKREGIRIVCDALFVIPLWSIIKGK